MASPSRREEIAPLLAERYERRSVMITSNLASSPSQWDQIFKDAMTATTAIDRVVHHFVILERTGKSFRSEGARKRNSGTAAIGRE